MTQILEIRRPKSLASCRPEDALCPPKLSVQNLARDLSIHLQVYRDNKVGIWTAAAFLILRVLHHAAYDRGWSKESRATKAP